MMLIEGMVSMDREIAPAESFNPKQIQRKTTLEAVGVGCLSFICVAVTCVCGLVSFFVTARLLPGNLGSGLNTWSVDWSRLDGLTSLATLALFVGGLTFAFIDYVRNAVQRKREDAEASFNIYKEVYDRLMSPRDLEARRWIILNLPTLEQAESKDRWLEGIEEQVNKVPPDWRGDRTPGQEHLKTVLNTFDFIGFVAKHYWNMDNELVKWMSPPIAKVWERIEVYVEEEAKQRNEDDYYKSARDFGKHCVEWRQNNHHPQSRIIGRKGT
jgi:hypothetical protein